MGSFDLLCSITDTPIEYGHNLAYILLLPGQRYKGRPLNTRGEISNTPYCLFTDFAVHNGGVFHNFQPFCMPIFGTYSDYGEFSYERNETVEKLENFFGLGIEDILPCFSRDQINKKSPRNNHIFPLLMGTFIHADTYHVLAADDTEFQHNFSLNKLFLETLNFIFKNNDEKNERYRYIVNHPLIQKQYLHDGTWFKERLYGLENFRKKFSEIDFNLADVWAKMLIKSQEYVEKDNIQFGANLPEDFKVQWKAIFKNEIYSKLNPEREPHQESNLFITLKGDEVEQNIERFLHESSRDYFPPIPVAIYNHIDENNKTVRYTPIIHLYESDIQKDDLYQFTVAMYNLSSIRHCLKLNYYGGQTHDHKLLNKLFLSSAIRLERNTNEDL